jgi:hypothetical protein
MLFAAIHTAYYARTGRSLLDRWPKAFSVLHSLLYSSVTTYPFLVTIVFWGILFRPPWFSVTFTGWQNVSSFLYKHIIRSRGSDQSETDIDASFPLRFIRTHSKR